MYVSEKYGLNPSFTKRAEHRVAGLKYDWHAAGPVVCRVHCGCWMDSMGLAHSSEAWASEEQGVQRSFAAYVMDRFQRNPNARPLGLYGIIRLQT